MSQAKVTSYYNTRKKRTEAKDAIVKPGKSKAVTSFAAFFAEFQNESSEKVSETNASASCESSAKFSESEKMQKVKNTKHKPLTKKAATKNKGKRATAQQPKQDIRLVFAVQQEKAVEKIAVEEEHPLNVTFDVEKSSIACDEPAAPRTPKRNLPCPNVENSDSKKKKIQSNTGISKDHEHVRRKLILTEESTSKAQEPKASTGLKSALSSLSEDKLDGLKGMLKEFDKSLAKLKESQTNKCNSCVPIPAPDRKEEVKTQEIETAVPAYVKYAALSAPGPSSLILPYRFKALNEIFRCLDTVVSMLYNRKELCTFAKVMNGVQDMTRKAFSKSYLGQIKTVFPEAYTLKVEKNAPAYINRNPGAPPYELVLYPNFKDCSSGSSPKKLDSPMKGEGSPSKSVTNSMTPAVLVERKNTFSNLLLEIVKKHHQIFLKNLKPPVYVNSDKLTKWHPKFALDSIPEVEPSPLPELPHLLKVSSAQDVLNKFRGTQVLKSFHGDKVKKALQSLVDKTSTKSPDKPDNSSTIKSGLLKGLSKDILERVRARESAKVVEDMTKTPEEKKRSEMLERIPELVRILRTYFIAERKAAVPLETAKKKLADSYHTTLNGEDAQLHIELMANIFPRWLTLIPIRKGVFVKIDKNMDINVLLQNMPKQ